MDKYVMVKKWRLPSPGVAFKPANVTKKTQKWKNAQELREDKNKLVY